VSVADLLRDYHQAVRTFDPTPHTWPASPPAPFAGELVSHNDVNLDNVVFREGRAVALIDFDLASPGGRVWDVACAARLWAPLRPESYIDDSRRGRALARFRLFVDRYGLAGSDREAVVSAIRENHGWSYDIIGAAAANGHSGFAEYWLGGAWERAERTREWYVDNADALQEALR
jgi:aminoglycoside phosphotransferase (APT) family kinase protein